MVSMMSVGKVSMGKDNIRMRVRCMSKGCIGCSDGKVWFRTAVRTRT